MLRLLVTEGFGEARRRWLLDVQQPSPL